MKNFANKFILFFVLSFLSVFCFVFGFNAFTVKAEESDFSLLIPNSVMEYKELVSPQNVYYDGEIFAVNEENKKLLIYNGEYVERDNFTVLGQIKKLNEDNLLVTDQGSIYRFNLSNFSKTAIKESASLENIGSNFDYNGTYLVTNDTTTATVYVLDGDSAIKYGDSLTTYERSPVAINSNGDIFYLNSSSFLCKNNVFDRNETELTKVTASKIVADNNFVYYIADNGIFMISVEGGSPVSLYTDEEYFDYDLGNLIAPTGICLFDDKLLVTDSGNNSVQEFEILNNGVLSFTGFAVAKGKTAYNRIGENSLDIESFNGNVAVLDDFKVTVLDTEKDVFYNFLLKNIEIDDISGIALGFDSVAVFGENGFSFIKNYKKNKTVYYPLDFEGEVIKDATYQSGNFYILTVKEGVSYLYSFNENEEKSNLITEYEGVGEIISVDVFGNIFVKEEEKLVKFYSGNYSEVQTYTQDFTAEKILFDLKGKPFYISENKINGKDVPLSTVSFSMDVIENKIRFISSGSELIYESESFGNFALSNIKADESYKITDESAKEEDLSVYTVKVGQNAYGIEKKENDFIFTEFLLSSAENSDLEFIEIYSFDAGDGKIFSVLAGENADGEYSLSIVDKDNLIIKEGAVTKNAEIVFTTTGVNVYYIPLITLNSEFSLNRNGEKLRLGAGSKLSTTKKITYLNKEFFFVELSFDDKTVYGYVPVNFTVKTLSEDVKILNYSLVKVKETEVLDSEGNIIGSLTEGATVRLIEKLEEKSFISYENNGVYLYGYVGNERIIVEADNTVKNAVIIVLASFVVASSLIFIIIKKNKNQ